MEQNAVGETRAAGRRQAARTTTVFSCMLVWFALTAPEQLSSLQPAAFARIPAEGLAGVALILLLPPKAVRVAAPIVGFALGLMTVVRVLDIGSFAVVDRPFDPVLDWSSATSWAAEPGRSGSPAKPAPRSSPTPTSTRCYATPADRSAR
jgi:hypothetical protein